MSGGTGSAGERGPVLSSYDAEVEVAWLDRDGVIVAVNDAWRTFCTANNGDLLHCGPGASYLAACEADPDASRIAAVLQAMLAGEQLLPAVFTVPCDGPHSPRWFDVHLSPRLDPPAPSRGRSSRSPRSADRYRE